jgi:hypothetical protein
MTYGYDSKLQDSQSFQSIEDLAISFVNHLKTIGADAVSAKPLILIAHSLGGLVVKRAIIDLARSGESERLILTRIRLLLFFGVPHQGMQIDHLRTVVGEQPNYELLESLGVDSNVLAELDEAFKGILLYYPMRLVSVYETVRSKVAEVSCLPAVRSCTEESFLGSTIGVATENWSAPNFGVQDIGYPYIFS